MLRKNKYHASDSRGTLGIKILVLINVWKKNSLCPSFHSFLAGGLIILTLSIIFLTPMNTLAVKDSSFEDYEIIELGSSKAFRKYNGLDNNRWPNNNVDWYYNPKNQNWSTDEVVAAIKRATANWSTISGINFTYRGLTEQSLSNSSDDKFVIGWLQRDQFLAQFGRNYAGYAYMWWQGGYVSDAEISLNLAASYSSIREFEGLMTHELGHILGLDHSNQSSSIMYSPYNSYVYQTKPKLDDLLAVTSLYPKSINSSGQPIVDCQPYITDTNFDIYIPHLSYEEEGIKTNFWLNLRYDGLNASGLYSWEFESYGLVDELVNNDQFYDFDCENNLRNTSLDLTLPQLHLRTTGLLGLSTYDTEFGYDSSYSTPRWNLVIADLVSITDSLYPQ
jgi:hypothetical protein